MVCILTSRLPGKKMKWGVVSVFERDLSTQVIRWEMIIRLCVTLSLSMLTGTQVKQQDMHCSNLTLKIHVHMQQVSNQNSSIHLTLCWNSGSFILEYQRSKMLLLIFFCLMYFFFCLKIWTEFIWFSLTLNTGTTEDTKCHFRHSRILKRRANFAAC